MIRTAYDALAHLVGTDEFTAARRAIGFVMLGAGVLVVVVRTVVALIGAI